MDADAGGHLSPATSPRAVATAAVRDACPRTPSPDEDCDDLYGDVNVGFLPLLPLSPSPAPTSPPKTPSPGRTPSPSPPPRHAPAPEPRPVPEPAPQQKPSAPQHQPPRPSPPAPAPRHQQMPPPQPQRAPRGDASASASYSSSSPPGAALYISELPWWATDAEVEAALALAPGAAPALLGLHFYADKVTGRSHGVCRADFLSAAAAASAAAALHGRAFHWRHCVASLSRPPVLHRLDDESYSSEAPQAAPNTARGRGSLGRGRGPSNATPVRGNVGSVLGDRPALAPVPPRSMAPQPLGPPFGGTMGDGGGYGGFQSPGQFNAGMGTGMMPPAVAPHVNSAFLAASGMAMRGPGVWHDQAMAGGYWGAQQQWNFRGCQMPWQQLTPTMQHQQAQQQHFDGDYGKGRGMRRARPGRNEDRGIGNMRSYLERRQSDHVGGDRYREQDREERGRRRERAPEKERELERHCDEEDRRRGDKRRYQEFTESDDLDRRARARARSQSEDDDYDDHPRRLR